MGRLSGKGRGLWSACSVGSGSEARQRRVGASESGFPAADAFARPSWPPAANLMVLRRVLTPPGLEQA